MTETTLGDRMAAAIDQRIAGNDLYDPWGADLSDDAFREAYAELGLRGVPAREISRVVEAVRRVRNDCTDIFGEPRDPNYERNWREKWRGLLVGYFSIPSDSRTDTAKKGPPASERIQFEDDARTVVLDGVRYAVSHSDAYYAYKAVYKSKSWMTNAQIADALGRGNEGARMDRLKKHLPPKLRATVKPGKKGKGQQVVLPER